jgi:hypothetical protein
LHRKDVKLLKLIQSYFGVGNIVKDGDNACAFVVRSLKDIREKILPRGLPASSRFSGGRSHFYNYPLKTKKLADYLL